MKISGQVRVKAPRAAVYEALRDARFFASCVEGVHDLVEIAVDRYEAVLEIDFPLSFRFKVTVELTRAEPPREIEAKVEGAPLGIVGRLTATALTTLSEEGEETAIRYTVEHQPDGKARSRRRCCAPRPRRWSGSSPPACRRRSTALWGRDRGRPMIPSELRPARFARRGDQAA